MFIGQQWISLQQCGLRHRNDRCKVHHNTPGGVLDSGLKTISGDFPLEQHNVRRPNGLGMGVHICCSDISIRAGYDDDAVFTVGVDSDHGETCGFVARIDALHIHPRRNHQGCCGGGIGIVSNGTDKSDFGALKGSGDGLVGPLAAWADGATGSEDGFTRFRMPVDPDA